MDLAKKKANDVKDMMAKIVGAEAVTDDSEALAPFTSGADKPALLVKPASSAQVRELVELAKAEGINLVPVSSGSPHHNGGTLPPAGAVMVDLSGMDKIIRKERRNKVAMIEPGVTFGQLKEAVEPLGLRILQPLLPRANKSVIASGLEREPITTPKYHWDMNDPLLCTEIVFGSGDLFRTGSAAGPGTIEQQLAAGHAQKNPLGPAQSDLVRVVQGAQGTMGMVTWATVKLEVKPRARKLFFVQEKDLGKLIDFSYQVLKPKQTDEHLILDRCSLACMLAKDPARIKDLAARQAPYTLLYTLAGYEYLPEERVAYLEQDVGRAAQACGVKPTREIPGATQGQVLELLDNPCPEPYWKERARGGWKDIFFLTTLDRVPDMQAVMGKALEQHGFAAEEMGTYIQPMQLGRNCHLEFDLFYDPANAAEAAKVDRIYREASVALAEAGAFFSRPYGYWAEVAYARCPDTVKALKMVKGMLDPGGVMNRGKLCFQEV
jgi:FAD/FMN-containing dehydrogenase